jgi:hypothetical protein
MTNLKNIAWLTMAYSFSTLAQSSISAGMPVKMIVTIGHHYGQHAPILTKDDLTIRQEYEYRPITGLAPLQGDRADLELFLLVDNCSSCDANSKFDEIRRFLAAQPNTTSIGVAYIKDGQLVVVQEPTKDRERATQALSAPTATTVLNPYGALTDLIKRWPSGATRREILMISTGINPGVAASQTDPTVEAAIEAAERGGVNIYAIYHPNAGYLTSDPSTAYAGQVQLAHVASETGGEAYFLGAGPLPSLAPFLADIADHLANQYELDFLANPRDAGALQSVMIESAHKDVTLVAPYRIWVPARAHEPKTQGGFSGLRPN